MSQGGQGANPFGTGYRGAGAGPTGTTVPSTNPPYNANPWLNTGPRSGGAMPGQSPGGPSTTMPGSIDPRFLTGDPTGGTSPIPTTPNPTLSQPTMSAPGGRQYFGPDGMGSMNKPMGVSGGYQGQALSPQSDQDFASSLYSGLLGRQASADEITNATTALQSQYGGDRSKLVDFFRQSDEFKSTPNAFTGSNQPWIDNTPSQWRNNRPFGTDQRIGSPGWQTMLRQYAGRDGQSPNAYMGGLTPMWGNEGQMWEQTPMGGSLSQLLRGYRGY
jgi:hypothetical protein